MKILILSHMYPNKSNPVSGIFIHNYAKALLNAGCKVGVVSPVPYSPKILWFNKKWKKYGEVPKFDTIDKIPVYYPRYIRLPGKWFHCLSSYTIYLGIVKTVSNIIMRDFKPDILHTHTATPDGYTGLLLKRKFNLPVVCSLRGSDINNYPYYDSFTMELTRKVISQADQLIAVSNALKLKAESFATPKNEIQVIYNGCDIKKFVFNLESRIATKKRLNIPLDNKVLIFVGNLLKTKGIYELIGSFILLSKQYHNLHLIVVGNGPEYQYIKEQAFKNGLKDKIYLVGAQPHNKIPDFLSAGDILVLPSYNEGLPNAVLDAMACSRAVVATKVGGIPEAVRDGETGFLVNEKDINSLVKGIDKLLSNEKLCIEMGLSGRKTIEQKFSWEYNVIEHIKIYEKLVQKN